MHRIELTLAHTMEQQALEAALRFRQVVTPIHPIQNTFSSIESALDAFEQVLLVDAEQSLKEPLSEAPVDARFHAIDLQSDAPGVVVAHEYGKKPVVLTADASAAGRVYSWRARRIESAPRRARELSSGVSSSATLAPVPPRTDVIAHVQQVRDACSDDVVRNVEKACIGEAQKEKKRERERERRARAKELEEALSPEEKAHVQAERKEKRRKQRMEKKLKCEEPPSTLASDDECTEHTDAPTPARVLAEKDDSHGEEAMQLPIGDNVVETTTAPVEDAAIRGHDEASVETPGTDAIESLIQQTRQAKGVDLTFYASPIPHDRHLCALERCSPPSCFHDILTLGGPCSHDFVLIHGPPGCGKTWRLLKELEELQHPTRCLLISPTNAGACALYTRCHESGFAAGIAVPASRRPIDFVLYNSADEVNMEQMSIVCCTASARNGYSLRDQRFEWMLVDEAALLPEAVMWGLLRPELTRIVMAGDPLQLRAHSASEEARRCNHNRSMMERLMSLSYPVTFLSENHRMHPELLALSNERWYGGRMRSVVPSGGDDDGANVGIVDIHIVEKGEEAQKGSSWMNVAEVDCIVDIARSLLAEKCAAERRGGVVILVPYAAQLVLVAQKKLGIPVFTVDMYQGREADTVILSFVRTKKEGFWSEASRMLVALTRARRKLVLVGSPMMIAKVRA